MDDQQRSLFINKLSGNDLNSIIIGTLLGDACIESQRNSMVFMHSIIHEDYLIIKNQILSNFVKVGKIGVSNNWGSNPDPDLRKAVRFRVYDQEFVNKYKNISYTNGVRSIPENKKLLTPLTLLFWYLDDGSLIINKQRKNNTKRALRIGLKSFSDESIIETIGFLESEYNIKFRPERVKGTITRICIYDSENINRFLNLFNPYRILIPESMKYKFQPEFHLTKKTKKFENLFEELK